MRVFLPQQIEWSSLTRVYSFSCNVFERNSRDGNSQTSHSKTSQDKPTSIKSRLNKKTPRSAHDWRTSCLSYKLWNSYDVLTCLVLSRFSTGYHAFFQVLQLNFPTIRTSQIASWTTGMSLPCYMLVIWSVTRLAYRSFISTEKSKLKCQFINFIALDLHECT